MIRINAQNTVVKSPHGDYFIHAFKNIGRLILIANGAGRRFWENRFLVSIGKVSYGIYVYHLAYAYLFGLVIQKLFGHAVLQGPVLIQILCMGIYLLSLFGLATLSYHAIEKRWLKISSGDLATNSAR